jgi:hypothetical protein
VGFRDDNGFLRSVETLDTLTLPRRVRGKPGMWVRRPCALITPGWERAKARCAPCGQDPAVCLRFADLVLGWLRQQVPADAGGHGAWLVEYVPGAGQLVLRPPAMPYYVVPLWFAPGPPPSQRRRYL